jgi:hypothetical protein
VEQAGGARMAEGAGRDQQRDGLRTRWLSRLDARRSPLGILQFKVTLKVLTKSVKWRALSEQRPKGTR